MASVSPTLAWIRTVLRSTICNGGRVAGPPIISPFSMVLVTMTPSNGARSLVPFNRLEAMSNPALDRVACPVAN